jgi:putative hydrolase of the HAD superfamily
MRYKYLFCDADDTLYDFGASEDYAMEATWAEFNVPTTPESLALYHKANRKAWADYEKGLIDEGTLRYIRFEKYFEEMGLDTDPRAFADSYLDRLASVSVLFPDSLDVLKELKIRGYKIYILSNGLHDVQTRRLHTAETEGIFEAVYTPFMIGYSKPCKEYFETIFQKLNFTPEDRSATVMIGDNLMSDIRGAINAGIDSIWANLRGVPENPEIRPTYEVHQIKELLDLLPSVSK